MSGSFSSRRMIGNGSGASQGLRSEKGAHDDNLCSSIDLVSDFVSKRVLPLVKLCARRFNGRRWPRLPRRWHASRARKM